MTGGVRRPVQPRPKRRNRISALRLGSNSCDDLAVAFKKCILEKTGRSEHPV